MIDLLSNLGQTEKFFLLFSSTVFCLAGLYMMIKPSMIDGEARIEFLGFKFNASSGGLIVFLVGTVLMAGTALAPDQPHLPQTGGMQSTAALSENSLADAETVGPMPAIDLPEGAETLELEPNNAKDQAFRIPTGVMFQGALDPKLKDVEDWFAIPTGQLENGTMHLKVVAKEGSGSKCAVSAYGEGEDALHSASLKSSEEANHQRYNVVGLEVIFLRFSCGGNYSYRYEFHVT